MSFSVEAISTNLSWGVNVAKDFSVQWGGYAVTALHEAISGPLVAQISNLFASTASVNPYVGPSIVALVTLVGIKAAHTLWNNQTNRIAQVAGLGLAFGVGAATAGTLMVALPTLAAGWAYAAGGSLTLATLCV